FVDFNSLLKRSDILSLHVPLNENTKHIINNKSLQKMKHDAIIINVARGELINQSDLIKALQNGYIRSAGLDVFEEEPLNKNSPLMNMDNVILSNHSAFRGEKSKKMQLYIAFNLINN